MKYNLLTFFKSHFILILLLFFAFIVRIGYVQDNIVPFNFDHGKDSLAAMDLILNRNLKFIGPWTSIPGLYFGPAWYYLISPGLLLSQFNPVGPVFVMIALVLIQVYLAYKYFGKFEALVVATSPFWLMISKSAWNPFPMTFLSWCLLILLKKYKKNTELNLKEHIFLGIFASLGFHFSAAFAIFYPIIILLFIIKNKLILSIKKSLLSLFGFFTPFVPQLLFEIKNNFVQTKAVLNYFTQGEPHEFGSEKILFVTKSFFSEVFNFIIPDLFNSMFSQLFIIVFLVISIYTFYKQGVAVINKKEFDVADLLIVIAVPYIGFLFLHYNVWYPYALAPVLVVLLGAVLRAKSYFIQCIFILLFVASPFFSYYRFYTIDREVHYQSTAFLPGKILAVNFIYEQSKGESFASYHFVPDIYDYTYQYIYFWQAQQGRLLPFDFSYKPNEKIYVKEKDMLLTNFNTYTENPKRIFYIVQKTDTTDQLQSWWNEQKFSTIVKETPITEEITVYEATP